MIFEIMMTIIAEDVNEAHEAAVQLAESRGATIQQIEANPIVIDGVDIDAATNGFALDVRMTPGTTPPPAPTPRPDTRPRAKRAPRKEAT